ncbi:MAG: vWA domain-containing protein [Steroidobacteraceae bacterium]
MTAAETVGIDQMADFRAALATTLLHRHEDRALFDAAFQAAVLAPLSATDPGTAVPSPPSLSWRNRRLASALAPQRPAGLPAAPVKTRELLAASDIETLRHRDFEQMSVAEARAALELVRRAGRWWRRPVRRWQQTRHGGRLDVRRSLREFVRRPEVWHLLWQRRRDRPYRLVLICDVSGSMRAYSRAFLQLAHALAGRDRSVELFAFATRLTRLTRLLRGYDADRSLARIGTAVPDWDSGTRIGSALARLTREWGPVVLGSSTIVVLLTDGLERGPAEDLRVAASRLKRSCRTVIWLNPLLRYDAYEPLARGAAVLADTLQAIRPAHDPASLEALVRSLGELCERP